MFYRVIKEDMCNLSEKIYVSIDGEIKKGWHVSNQILYPGLYKRLLYEDDDISWIYLNQDGSYDADSFEYITDGKSKALETFYQESEVRLKAINRDKKINEILS